MSEDPGELERFYAETVAPLSAYDEQYETELVTTIEAYLENDGNVTPTADQLFTHRHTIRYRLERVKELSGHDITSTEGREKLGLGLKSMRVLGIARRAARRWSRAPRAGGQGAEGESGVTPGRRLELLLRGPKPRGLPVTPPRIGSSVGRFRPSHTRTYVRATSTVHPRAASSCRR